MTSWIELLPMAKLQADSLRSIYTGMGGCLEPVLFPTGQANWCVYVCMCVWWGRGGLRVYVCVYVCGRGWLYIRQHGQVLDGSNVFKCICLCVFAGGRLCVYVCVCVCVRGGVIYTPE